MPSLPPRPHGWNKTLDDLMAEHRMVSGQELSWARAYEQEQLRAWARFPRDGEVHEAAMDCEVTFLTHWAAPYTGGGKAKLPAGARIRVAVLPGDPEPIAVAAEPLDDGSLERELVPEAERTSAKYGGFSLSVGVAELNRSFRLVRV